MLRSSRAGERLCSTALCFLSRSAAPPRLTQDAQLRLQAGFGTHFIASRLSRAKIKCSICSSQFNTWDAQHRWALVLIVCLNRGRRSKARFVAPTGCPGIAVPPGSALTHHRWVSSTDSDALRKSHGEQAAKREGRKDASPHASSLLPSLHRTAFIRCWLLSLSLLGLSFSLLPGPESSWPGQVSPSASSCCQASRNEPQAWNRAGPMTS